MTTTDRDRLPDELLEEAGANYRYHRDLAERARTDLAAQILDAADAGVSESEIARVAGVTRMTVRKALGK